MIASKVLITHLYFAILSSSMASFSRSDQPMLHVSPDSALYDTLINIKIEGLKKNTEVLVKLRCTDGNKIVWTSSAVFLSDKNGEVLPEIHEPLSGNYIGVHGMGLFWSMKNTMGATQFSTQKSFKGELSVFIAGKKVTGRVIHRISSREHTKVGITCQPIKEKNWLGNFYYPTKIEKQVPTILLLGGSGGSFQDERASLLACHGYAVLDLPYFRHEGLPDNLEHIPIEYIEKALIWLKKQFPVDGDRMGIMGKSKGAELALIAATYFPEIKLVVSDQGTSVAWSGIGTYTKSSWTWKGQEIAFARGNLWQALRWLISSLGRQNSQLSYMKSAFTNSKRIEQATIFVEKINGPILFITGDDDQLWPSAAMALSMKKRLNDNYFPYEAMHLNYHDAGHNFGGGEQSYGLPYLPPRDRSHQVFLKGGTPQGNSIAAEKSWPETLAFLARHL